MAYAILFSAIILLTTGRASKKHHYDNRISPSSEIIDLLSPKFKYEFQEDNLARSISSGGIIQNQPIICGGTDEDGDDLQDSVFLGQNKTQCSKICKKVASTVCIKSKKSTFFSIKMSSPEWAL